MNREFFKHEDDVLDRQLLGTFDREDHPLRLGVHPLGIQGHELHELIYIYLLIAVFIDILEEHIVVPIVELYIHAFENVSELLVGEVAGLGVVGLLEFVVKFVVEGLEIEDF